MANASFAGGQEMERSDCSRKDRQRAAYAEYVRLQWRLYGLPQGAPRRAALQEAVRRADRHWRSLIDTPRAVPVEQFIVRGDRSGALAHYASADAVWAD